MRQNPVLHHEFDIHHAAARVFQVSAVALGRPFGAINALAHIDDVAGQLRAVALGSQYLLADRVKRLFERSAAGHPARADQRLMLPGPRVFELITLEGVARGYQQAGRTLWTQPRIDFV